ncbi:hypothetical protein [Streptomyces tsukubensis]|uniref:hypothetical protein n=1 Tax=Streptomyces tsukubensis TaxID=83656 RepID=UPI00117BFFD5|nr:hypothetical protein [Streptomyces tsukubensis]QFR94107.1 hypothetical protein GBW32_14910 [Streptomyces tsukubensis]
MDALTHSGPGYDLTPDDDGWDDSGPGGGRILDAVTHSGPGYAYSLSAATEMAENAALKQRRNKELNDALLEGFDRFRRAVRSLEAAALTEDRGEKNGHRERAVEGFRAYLQHADGAISLALNAAREALGPLDVRPRLALNRLDRMLRKSAIEVRDSINDLEQSERPGERIIRQSQVAVKQATSSWESICHV